MASRERAGEMEPGELLARLTRAGSTSGWRLLDLTRWQRVLLDHATEDEAFRTRLLRFVDVLPTLQTDAAVAAHLAEYFEDEPAGLIRRAIGLARNPVLEPLLARAVGAGVHAMAGRFIAGATPEQALPQLHSLIGKGMAFTVDLLGEATLAEDEARAYLAAYQDLIALLAPRVGRERWDVRWEGAAKVNVSVKLSSLTAHFEPAAPAFVVAEAGERLKALLRTARAHGAYVHVDMEQHRYRDLVHRVFEAVLLDPEFRDVADVGIVAQAYLQDAAEDIARLRQLAGQRGTPFTVRLVKGAYWDEERIVAAQHGWPVPVWEEKAATDASYQRCAGLLLDAWPRLRPAFGSHNPATIADAVQQAARAGLTPRDFEIQMLFGLAPELSGAVAELGYRLRLYVPVGAIIPGMAYLVRRLLENTSNQAWFRSPGASGAVPTGRAAQPVVAAQRARFVNAAPARFHEPEVRAAMDRSLDEVRAAFGARYPLLMGDERVDSRPLDEVRYPADPSVLLGTVAQGGSEDVERAVAIAASAFPAWAARPAPERAAVLRRAAGLLEERRFEFAATMVFESAKPWREADGDVTEALDYLRYYAAQAETLLGETHLAEPPGESNEYLREPRGVAAIIAPWNFPLAILTGMTVAALVTGNTAVVKPAGPSPIIAYKLVELLREAGTPPGAVQFLPGSGETVGQGLVDHPLVSTIAFTGSNAVGLGIMGRAAVVHPGQRTIKRVIAELGGKNAIIIDEDADLDLAIADSVASAFGYAGQKCSACSRLVIVGSAYQPALSRLRAAVASLEVGPPHEPQTVVPPVITAAARERIERYAALGDNVAKLLVRGRAPAAAGHYVAPRVFTGVPLDSPLARDEIFGPVLSVFQAHDFETALHIAGDSAYGLTGGLFSRHPAHIAQARRGFVVGNLYINRRVTGAVVGRQAFGGLNMSGEGEKAGGPDYLRQFTVSRTITENTMRRGYAPRHPAT